MDELEQLLSRSIDEAKGIEEEHQAMIGKVHKLIETLDHVKKHQMILIGKPSTNNCIKECGEGKDINGNEHSSKYQELLQKYEELEKSIKRTHDESVTASNGFMKESIKQETKVNRDFDTNEFLQNLRASDFPCVCPFNGCPKKSYPYKSFRGISNHLLTWHPITVRRSEPPPAKVIKLSDEVIIDKEVVVVPKESDAKEESKPKESTLVVGLKTYSETGQKRVDEAIVKSSTNSVVPKSSIEVPESSNAVVPYTSHTVADPVSTSNEFLLKSTEDAIRKGIVEAVRKSASVPVRVTRGMTSRAMGERPEWMTKEFYDGVLSVTEHSLSVKCLGCKKELNQDQMSSRYRLEDYVHMIDECNRYNLLGLVQECNKCGSKFIFDTFYLTHYC